MTKEQYFELKQECLKLKQELEIKNKKIADLESQLNREYVNKKETWFNKL